MQRGAAPILILMGLIILIVLGGGVYYFTQINAPKNAVQTPKPSLTPTDETANWKIYTNSKDGYSIKYPNTKLINCGSGGEGFYLFKGEESTRSCGLGEEPTEFYITTEQGAKSYQKSSYEQCYAVKKEEIVIAGLTATKYSNSIKSDIGACNNQIVSHIKGEITIDLNYKDKYYQIFYRENENLPIYEKILSTIKFLDPTDETANWKTYTGKNLKITFKYPSYWEIAKEMTQSVAIGQKALNGYETFLVVSSNQHDFTDINSFRVCSESSSSKPCISEEGFGQEEAIAKMNLGGIEAQNLYLVGGGDYAFHIVQTESEPKIELKMNVAGGGLDTSFQKILSTFRFLK